jgi:hypothetical protein
MIVSRPATPAYRENWDRIFGDSGKPDEAYRPRESGDDIMIKKELLLRLYRGGAVVGYELHKDGDILHSETLDGAFISLSVCDTKDYYERYAGMHIFHDSFEIIDISLFTGHVDPMSINYNSDRINLIS